MQTGGGGLLERVTSDNGQKHEIHVRTNESIEPLSCLGCLLASVFFWVAVLANRRLVEHRVGYKLHVEKPLDSVDPLSMNLFTLFQKREKI